MEEKQESKQEKQAYLSKEIIDSGYDAQDFSDYFCDLKGLVSIDLDLFPLEDLKNIVDSYKKMKLEEKNIGKDFDILFSGANKDENNKENIINCKKLEKNELTEIEDLNVVVKPSKSKSSKEYDMETNPIGFKTIRKLNDFEYLYQKLSLINPKIFNPLLILEDLEKDSKIIVALNLYINSVIESSYFRSLSIVYDFLKLSLEDWEKVKKEKYDYIKIVQLKDIQNLDGFFNLEEIEENENNFLKIEEIIKPRFDAFKKANKAMEEVFKAMDKMSSAIKSFKESLTELTKSYWANKKCLDYFANLNLIIKVWGEGYFKQKIYLNDELNYFFEYMNKENKSFLEFYSSNKKIYKIASKILKSDKNKYINKKEYAFKEKQFIINNFISEYKNYNKRQANRFENVLFRCEEEKKNLFSDIESFYYLLNIHKERRENKRKKLEEEQKNKLK